MLATPVAAPCKASSIQFQFFFPGLGATPALASRAPRSVNWKMICRLTSSSFVAPSRLMTVAGSGFCATESDANAREAKTTAATFEQARILFVLEEGVRLGQCL